MGATRTVDTEVIFNRTLGIIDSGECDLHDLYYHELAPIRTSLFLDGGSLRPTTSKSKHNNYLQVEESSRTVERPDLIVLGGCAILWTINCPISGTLLDLVNAVAAYVHARLMNSDVHLIFDIYLDYSTKRCTRGRRASVTADRCYYLILQSPLQPQSVSLTVTDK